jgi:hypothetical protein
VTLDSSLWEKTPSETLASTPGKSSFQVFADAKHLYVKVNTSLASNSASRVELFLVPSPGQAAAFRFRTGLDPNTKEEAAAGKIKDVMDPRFGQFDPDWKEAWTCQTRPDPDKEHWQVHFSIPFTSLGIKQPQSGAFWRANLAVLNKNSVSTWSTAAGVRRPDDRSGSGEWVFGSKKPEKP